MLWVGDSLLEFMHIEHYFPDSINVGISGMCTKLQYEELGYISEFQQEIVLFYCGGNDLDRGVTPTESFEYYERTVEHWVDQNKKVILLGLHRQFAGHRRNAAADEFNSLMESLAERLHLTFIPTPTGPTGLYDDAGFMRRKFTPDGEHLNSAGYKVWTDAIRKELILASIVAGDSN